MQVNSIKPNYQFTGNGQNYLFRIRKKAFTSESHDNSYTKISKTPEPSNMTSCFQTPEQQSNQSMISPHKASIEQMIFPDGDQSCSPQLLNASSYIPKSCLESQSIDSSNFKSRDEYQSNSFIFPFREQEDPFRMYDDQGLRVNNKLRNQSDSIEFIQAKPRFPQKRGSVQTYERLLGEMNIFRDRNRRNDSEMRKRPPECKSALTGSACSSIL